MIVGGWVGVGGEGGGGGGSGQIIMTLCGSILQAVTCKILSLAEN